MAHALAHLQLLEQRHDGVAGLAGHGHGGATERRVVDAVGVHGAGLLAPGADVHPAVGVHVAGPPGADVLVAVGVHVRVAGVGQVRGLPFQEVGGAEDGGRALLQAGRRRLEAQMLEAHRWPVSPQLDRVESYFNKVRSLLH